MLAALTLVLAAPQEAPAAPGPPPRTNVVLLMADDLGWGDPSYAGHPRLETPHLDAMAASGLVLERFYAAAPVCSPTRGSVLTGRHPSRYGIPTANAGHLRRPETTLAELARAADVATGHFGKWHLGTMTADWSGKGPRRDPARNVCPPSDAGFDTWFSTEFAVATWDPYAPENSHRRGKEWDARALFWRDGAPLAEPLAGCTSRIVMDEALAFVDGSIAAGRPFLAVVWFHAPHEPVVGGPAYLERYADVADEGARRYYAVVSALDDQVGRLRAHLRERGVAEDTLLWFCSDNGPEGNPAPVGRRRGSTGGLRGRKRSLYEGGVRVPGIVEWPARIAAGGRTSTPCSTSDVLPTLAAALGWALPPGLDGEDVGALFEDPTWARTSPIGFATRAQASWVEGRWKLVRNDVPERPRSDDGDAPFEPLELYDVAADPGETRNLAADHPERVARMAAALQRWQASCAASERATRTP